MYRALTWLALQEGVALEDEPALAELARQHPVTFEGLRVFVDGREVTSAIREPDIDRAVPVVARQQAVRAVMRDRQRVLADEGDAVIEGRDIGRVVVPNAPVKVYLVADVGERARRRLAERPGLEQDALTTDIRLRDESDRKQMEPADDAERIDTTDLSIDEVVSRIEERVRAASVAS
jgi:cytidylate kinase